jgi:hypothetical protein
LLYLRCIQVGKAMFIIAEECLDKKNDNHSLAKWPSPSFDPKREQQ